MCVCLCLSMSGCLCRSACGFYLGLYLAVRVFAPLRLTRSLTLGRNSFCCYMEANRYVGSTGWHPDHSCNYNAPGCRFAFYLDPLQADTGVRTSRNQRVGCLPSTCCSANPSPFESAAALCAGAANHPGLAHPATPCRPPRRAPAIGRSRPHRRRHGTAARLRAGGGRSLPRLRFRTRGPHNLRSGPKKPLVPPKPAHLLNVRSNGHRGARHAPAQTKAASTRRSVVARGDAWYGCNRHVQP
eukprot:SAG11_NODE_1618_length_4571_cov_11.714733_3_plen_242_part_00